jgi:UDP-N-acetylmuramyl pentapeptide phosphotransferase/UDP-N-acetylglucosamine-1-phosphate transferase
MMLGDTGANPLGAAMGLAVVLAGAPTTRLWALIAVVLLNIASEFASFSKVIAVVPPFRALDGVGRLR